MRSSLSFHSKCFRSCTNRTQKLTHGWVITSSHSSLHTVRFIFMSTRSKSDTGRPLVGFSLSNPLSVRADSARWLIRFIRNEVHSVGSDFSHRCKARECNLHWSRRNDTPSRFVSAARSRRERYYGFMKFYESPVSRHFRSCQMNMESCIGKRLSFWKRAGNHELHSAGNENEFKIITFTAKYRKFMYTHALTPIPMQMYSYLYNSLWLVTKSARYEHTKKKVFGICGCIYV